MCADCGLKTSATAGTIFHRSHTPLSTWFAAIWFVTSQKNGVSARGLQDALGFASYETAWAWLHKLRRVMVRPERELLGGVVELDQRRCQVVCVNTSLEVSIDDGCCGIRTWGVGGAWAGV